MRIAVIGAGNVGSALGGRWAALGHDVVFGVRDPAAPRVADLLRETGVASAVLPREAAAAATVVVLALPWDAVEGRSRASAISPARW